MITSVDLSSPDFLHLDQVTSTSSLMTRPTLSSNPLPCRHATTSAALMCPSSSLSNAADGDDVCDTPTLPPPSRANRSTASANAPCNVRLDARTGLIRRERPRVDSVRPPPPPPEATARIDGSGTGTQEPLCSITPAEEDDDDDGGKGAGSCSPCVVVAILVVSADDAVAKDEGFFELDAASTSSSS